MRDRYRNPHQRRLHRHPLHFLLLEVGYYRDPSPLHPVPAHFVYPEVEKALDLSAPKVTWINHSTFLVEVGGVRFLTDPIWSYRCSPVRGVGPRRRVAPALALERLPALDVILISHDHYDHLDRWTVEQLHERFPDLLWVVPEGVGAHLRRWLRSVTLCELGWWESFGWRGVRFTSVPAQHFSGRTLWDRNATLWMGCVVEVGEQRFYFAGDTGYNVSDFKEIGHRFGEMGLSLIPIGAYSPREFMGTVHVDPKEAVAIHMDVRSRLSVGGHFGTFRLSRERPQQPPYDLFCALSDAGLSAESFRVLTPGKPINWY